MGHYCLRRHRARPLLEKRILSVSHLFDRCGKHAFLKCGVQICIWLQIYLTIWCNICKIWRMLQTFIETSNWGLKLEIHFLLLLRTLYIKRVIFIKSFNFHHGLGVQEADHHKYFYDFIAHFYYFAKIVVWPE